MRRRTVPRHVWIPILAGYLLLRGGLLFDRGYVADTNAYKRWALRAAQSGIGEVYAKSDMDYPPLYAWILYPLGKVSQWADPEGAVYMQERDSRLLTVLVKLPPLLFDFGVAWLLYRLGRRTERTGGAGTAWSAVLPAAYLLNPAIVFDTGYWGQPDSIHSFFVLGAFLSLAFPRFFRGGGDRDAAGARSADSAPSGASERSRNAAPGRPEERSGTGRAWPAWVLLSLGTLMKPLGAPFFPLLLLLSLRWHGLRATVAGIAAAGLTTIAVFSPFLAAGNLGAVLQRVVADVQVMPNTSSNAHNFWWLLGAWKPADVPVLGPLTSRHIGLGLFGLTVLALLWRAGLLHPGRLRADLASRRGDRANPQFATPPAGPAGLILALGVSLAFFTFSTHLHENHLFLAVPFAIALLPFAAPGERATRWLAAGLSLGLLLNLAGHDLLLANRFPLTLGGPVGVINQHLKRPFFGGELVTVWLGTFLNLALFAWYLRRTVLRRGPGWLERPAGPQATTPVARAARR